MRKILSGILLAAFMSAPAAAQESHPQKKEQTGFDVSRDLEVFADIYRQLDMFYVDTLSADTAIQWAINGMLAEIDPYTSYYPDDDQDDLRRMATGRYAGIGALIRAYKKLDRCVIEEPYENCPAQEAGVRAGDIIITIDGKDIKGWPTAKVSENLRGEPGTTFELVVQRPGEAHRRTFKITRRQIQLPCLPWYGMVDEASHTGYLLLTEFTDRSAREVRHALLDMKQQGMQRLVLDLRDNGGGAISEAVEIVGFFVPRGSLVVSTKGKVPATCHDYMTPAEPIDTLMPVAVLVNSNTASAAEIVSGALQDLDRAVILGQRTYGKGLVQGVREVSYRGQLKITTARYYTPSGRSIQKPYEKGKMLDYARDVINRYNKGELTNADSIHFPDSLRYQTLRKGRTVYGGGGIMPDCFVPLDTTRYAKCYRELSAKSIIINANLRHMDKHRKKLTKAYPSFEKFKAEYQVPQELIDEIFAEGEKQNIRPKDDEERQKTIENIRLIVKGLVARDLWDMSEYFAIIYENDDVVKKAVELLQKP